MNKFTRKMKHKRGYYDFFVNTVAKFPTNIAVRWYEDGCYKEYTYSELYGVCEYISQTLTQLNYSRGTIGVITERNILVPSVIAAAHKCSSTFMFIDPTQEIETIVKKFDFKAIISIRRKTDPHVSQCLERFPDKTVEVLGFSISCFVPNITKVPQSAEQNLYSFIALTSGSSGEPKHIQVPVECIQPNVDDLMGLFDIIPQDVIYFSTPLTFDPSMIEILLACKSGASLLIAPEEADILFPEKSERSVTIWQTTPSKFYQFSDADIRQKILGGGSTLKILALGGEPLSGVKLLKELKCASNKTRIFTLYGLTEMSCWACCTELDLDKLDNDRDIPLGNCLSETQVYVEPIDEDKCVGQIILKSKSRSCSIQNKSTEEVKSLNKIYTGDLGEVRNGKIYYRGRKDDIIKRFGHKVNLKLIENTIMQCNLVKTCSCIWLPRQSLIVVYYTSESYKCDDLSTFLKSKLDDKYLPDKIIRVGRLPMNKHGKISKNSLLDLYLKSGDFQNEHGELDLMNELKTILRKNFSYDEVKDKDFFSLGGTSFMAVAMCNKISQTTPVYGKKILSLLLSKRNTIGTILKKAEKLKSTNHNMDKGDQKVKRLRRNNHDDDTFYKTTASSNIIPETNESNKTSLQQEIRNTIKFQVAWSYDTGKCVDASPTLFETSTAYVVVGSHSGKIAVFNAANGDILGEMFVSSRIEASVHCFHHPPSTPRGVVGTYDGTIVCFTLDSCKTVWRINIKSMIKSKATICSGLLYIASYDGNVRCIDVKDGEIKKVIHIADQPITADLALAKDEYLLLGTLSGVCASVHTGSGVCASVHTGSGMCPSVHTGSGDGVVWRDKLSSPVFASPVLYDDEKFVIFAEVCGEIHCRTVEKGIKIWQFHQVKGNIFSSLHVKQVGQLTWQMVFGCHDRKVYSIMVNQFRPSLHWTSQLPAQVYATPCALRDEILATATNGHLCVIESDNGAILGQYQFPNETFSSPVVYNDYIFIGCRNDHVYSLKCSSTL